MADDIRISTFDLRASAGMTQRLRFTSPDALTSLSLYVGGTVTDVDSLTGATEYAGTLSGGDLIATVDLVVPTGTSTPLRLVVNGAVQTVGILSPSTNGAANPDADVTLSPGVYDFDLTILGVIVQEGGGGGGGAPTDATYLVTTSNGDLSAEVVVGATPGGELGGTWASPTVDATHSGSTHAAVQAAAEATAAADATAKVAALSTVYQPLDSDLTAIAALTTTAFGRALLALADASALRTSAGLVLGTDIYSKSAVDSGFQPLDSDLTSIAALTTTAYGRSVLEAANAAALRTLAGVVIGTDVQAYDADLAAIAALTSAANKMPYSTGAGTWALADLTAAARTFLASATAANVPIADAAGDFTAEDVEGALAELQTFDEALPSLATGVRWTLDLVTTPGTGYGNVDLATGIAGGDTLTGGTASGENLLLEATSHATRGTVALLASDPTYTATPAALFGVLSTRTITANYSGQRLPALVREQSTRVMTTAGNAGALANLGFDWQVTYKNANGVAAHLASGTLGFSTVAFMDRSTVTADGATVTLGQHVSFRSAPTFNISNAGAFQNGSLSAFASAPTVSTGATIASLNHFAANDVTNTGTVDIQVGFNIGTLAGATLNIGIQNASTTVDVPTSKTITATTDTVPITAGVIRLNNTSGSSKTLASTPTMADGQNGQVIELLNTSAQDVVLQDEATLASSNLFLKSATRTIPQYASIRLRYSTNVGAWVEVGFSPPQRSAYTQTYATADKTHAAATAATLTDNTAGTANTTLEALTSGTVYATDVAAIRNNFADLAAMVNKLTADQLDTKQLCNSIIDDLQALGLVG